MAGILTIHYGLMGSGKTLFAMQDVVLPAVREHRPFFTNITGVNLSAISWITGVHPSHIKYYPVENIHDVIAYFDNNDISHDGVFVLDEMKDFVDDEKAIGWLESRLNIMRKMGVDFVFIAQQNKRQYIHPDLVGLCDTCNVFVSRKSKWDKSNVDCYYCQGGDPKIVNKVPMVYDGVSVRKKDERVFLTYKTSESKYYNGKENDSYRGLMWYQTSKWKKRFIIFFVFFLVVLAAVYLISSVLGLVDYKSITKTNKVGNNDNQQSIQHSSPVAGGSPSCFHYIVCNEFDCETDFGVFPSQMYDDGVLCGVDGNRCVRKCERNIEVPSGGGLLPFGK